VIGITRVGLGEQCVYGGAVCLKLIDVVFSESSLGNGLDYPVHLDQVPGSVNLRQGQPVQLIGRGAKTDRGGQELHQARWIIDVRRVPQEKLGRDRFRGEEGAQVEQVPRVVGKQLI
jgi:hypothetical protein